MKRLVLLPVLLILSGCATHAVPLTPKFPDAPDTLKVECDKLKEATENMTLSEYTRTVVDNYMKYHECAVKVKGWNEWYVEQKKIFETATTKH